MDQTFAGRLLDWAYAILHTTLHIVRKPADQRSFVVIPPVAVERTFAWLTAHRRLARDYERDPAGSNDTPSPPQVDLLKHSVRNARTSCGRRSRTD